MRQARVSLALTAAILSATLVASMVSDRRMPASLARRLDAFPARLGDWVAAERTDALSPRAQASLAATEYMGRIYRRRGSAVDLFIAYYANQRAGESMHSPKHCLPGGGWEFSSFGTVNVPVGGTTVRINRDRIQKNGQGAIVLYWYQTQDRIIAEEYLGKVYLAWDALTRGHASGSIVRLFLGDNPGAQEDGIQFASLVIPQVQESFGR